MERIGIQTTQNIDLEYQLASLSDRIYAFIIDRLVILGYILIWVLGISILDTLEDLVDSEVWLVILLIAAPVFFYDLISEITLNGRSIGKRIMNTQVIREDGGQANVGNYLIRWVLGLFDIQLANGSIAVVSIIFNKKSQRLGDIAAGTVVVKLGQKIKLYDSLMPNISEDHEVSFLEVRKLTDKDIDIIKKVLLKARSSENPMLIHKLSEKVQSTMEIESNMPPLKFLDTALKDYYYLNSRFD